MAALQVFNGGVIIISHDERFITTVSKEVGDLSEPLVSEYAEFHPSYGRVQTARSSSIMVMFKLTRLASL
jgi:ATPase subunit of ABC transporter with duplicated ATPase domains